MLVEAAWPEALKLGGCIFRISQPKKFWEFRWRENFGPANGLIFGENKPYIVLKWISSQ